MEQIQYGLRVNKDGQSYQQKLKLEALRVVENIQSQQNARNKGAEFGKL